MWANGRRRSDVWGNSKGVESGPVPFLLAPSKLATSTYHSLLLRTTTKKSRKTKTGRKGESASVCRQLASGHRAAHLVRNISPREETRSCDASPNAGAGTFGTSGWSSTRTKRPHPRRPRAATGLDQPVKNWSENNHLTHSSIPSRPLPYRENHPILITSTSAPKRGCTWLIAWSIDWLINTWYLVDRLVDWFLD